MDERRTVVRSTFEMTSTLLLRATRAPVRRRSSCSRLGNQNNGVRFFEIGCCTWYCHANHNNKTDFEEKQLSRSSEQESRIFSQWKHLAARAGVRGTGGHISVLGPTASVRSNSVLLDSPNHEDDRRKCTHLVRNAFPDKR